MGSLVGWRVPVHRVTDVPPQGTCLPVGRNEDVPPALALCFRLLLCASSFGV